MRGMASQTRLDIVGVRTPGLGDTTYIGSLDGIGVLVDPQRDVDRFLSESERHDIELRWILETHLHNDYVSGAREAARRTGAELVLPAAAAPAYRHIPAFHMEDLGGGRLTIRPIHTPGHTPEHTSYLVLVDGEAEALFSGGSLLIGSAGRPDLLGDERADTMARLQHLSVHRLAGLAPEVGLYPTHGEGSFCTVAGAGRHTSTIGRELADNPMLAHPDEDSSVAAQLRGLQPYPAYYAAMAPLNLIGPAPMPASELPELGLAAVASMGDDVTVVDARPRLAFAAGHLPGSIGIELRDDFGVWVGWLADPARRIALVLDPGQNMDEAVTQLGRIGRDDLTGVVRFEGLDREAAVSSYPTVGVDEFAAAVDAGAQVLDVRSPAEWEAGHLPGSVHRYVLGLTGSGPDGIAFDEPVWVACGSGVRASMAAGLLLAQGIRPVVLAEGGVDDVIRRLSLQVSALRPAPARRHRRERTFHRSMEGPRCSDESCQKIQMSNAMMSRTPTIVQMIPPCLISASFPRSWISRSRWILRATDPSRGNRDRPGRSTHPPRSGSRARSASCHRRGASP